MSTIYGQIIRQIPSTSKQAYLTGMTAVNIPSKEGTGDWHFHDAFFGYPDVPPRYFLAGKDIESTVELFGEQGIYDCEPILREYGVFNQQGSIYAAEPTGPIYAADHYRASADLILHYLAKYSLDVFSVDDWLSTVHEKERLMEFMRPIRYWIGNEKWTQIAMWMSAEMALG